MITAGAHSSQPSRRSALAPRTAGRCRCAYCPSRGRLGDAGGAGLRGLEISPLDSMASCCWLRAGRAAGAGRGRRGQGGGDGDGDRLVGGGLGPDAAALEGVQDLGHERVAALDQPRVPVEAGQGGRQPPLTALAQPRCPVAQATDGVEGLLLVAAKGADGQVDAAHRGPRGISASTLGYSAQAICWRWRARSPAPRGGRRVVDLEAALPVSKASRSVLHLHAQRGSAAPLVQLADGGALGRRRSQGDRWPSPERIRPPAEAIIAFTQTV